MSQEGDKKTQEAVYIYEAPVRIWHWINALAIVVLCISGYLIGSPLPSTGGEAYDHYVMGTVRWVHFASAYIVIVGFVFRFYWAFVGNKNAQEVFTPFIWSLKWWKEVWHEVKWYAMIEREPMKYYGHNPLAVIAIHFLFGWTLIFMIVTGLALYGEGTGAGSWQNEWFSSWVIPLFGQSQDVHTWHHVGMWVMICFIIVHIYVAIREDIMSRQSLVSSMISGWRMFKDDRPADGKH